ncbi:hypothetical protein FHY13_003121 [Xanthomonas arboricola]|nr:hypothetical protein [Xanthomonas euroxanthea]
MDGPILRGVDTPLRSRGGESSSIGSVNTAKQLAEALGIPSTFPYTEYELWAPLLLWWNEQLHLPKEEAVQKSGENVGEVGFAWKLMMQLPAH